MCIYEIFFHFFDNIFMYISFILSHIFTTENAQWKIKLKIFMQSLCKLHWFNH